MPRTRSHKKKLSYRGGMALATISFLVMGLLDLGLQMVDLVPPEHPSIFAEKTYTKAFTPFVEERGFLTIKPDWVNEDDIYRRSQGKAKGRVFLFPGFRQTRFSVRKDPDTIRIFVFGGSTTFGQFVGSDYAFSALLQQELKGRYEGKSVEVINLGCPGLDSERVKILLNSVIGLDPDLLIMYSGNNEMLKGEMASLSGTAIGESERFLLANSAIFRWVHFWISSIRESDAYRISNEEARELVAGRIRTYVPVSPTDQQRLPSLEFLEIAARDYESNIRSIAEIAQREGVPILFVLPITNLFWSPVRSAHEEQFERRSDFQKLLDKARNEAEGGELDKAVATLDEAIELSPSFAMAWFMRGVIESVMGRHGEGRSSLQKANDLDALTHRFTSRLESTMLKAVRNSGAELVDLRAVFHRDMTIEASRDLFVDHCHPTKLGHRLIAEQISPAIAKLIPQEPSVP